MDSLIHQPGLDMAKALEDGVADITIETMLTQGASISYDAVTYTIIHKRWVLLELFLNHEVGVAHDGSPGFITKYTASDWYYLKYIEHTKASTLFKDCGFTYKKTESEVVRPHTYKKHQQEDNQ